jgi:hypothetical protein
MPHFFSSSSAQRQMAKLEQISRWARSRETLLNSNSPGAVFPHSPTRKLICLPFGVLLDRSVSDL